MSKMTQYQILEHQGDNVYKGIGLATARGPEQAVLAFLDKVRDEGDWIRWAGTYVAVPTRNWKEVPIVIETTTQVKVARG